MDFTNRSLSRYEQLYIRGFIRGFSNTVAEKFQNEIAEKLKKKINELLNTSSIDDIDKLLDKATDSFYYYFDVISKDKFKSIENSDKTE